MNDVTVHVERWSRHTCRQLYLCTLDVDVNEEVRDAFCFSWLDYGVIWAVIDDFGDLVPLGPRQERWLRLYWQVEWMAIVTNANDRYVDLLWGIHD